MDKSISPSTPLSPIQNIQLYHFVMIISRSVINNFSHSLHLMVSSRFITNHMWILTPILLIPFVFLCLHVRKYAGVHVWDGVCLLACVQVCWYVFMFVGMCLCLLVCVCVCGYFAVFVFVCVCNKE